MSSYTGSYLHVDYYLEVINGINTVFSFSEGVVKLTGPTGVGKSRLAQQVFEELQLENFNVVLFSGGPKTVDDIQSSLIRQFNLGADLSFRKSLVRFLTSKPREQQRLIIIVDDAELVSVEVLKALHALRELENNKVPLVSLLLCGTDELNTVLQHEELFLLQSEVSLSYSLQPLDFTAIDDFTTAFLQSAGKGKARLSHDYLSALQRGSEGYPAKILEQLSTDLANPDFLTNHGANSTKAVKTNSGISSFAPSQPPEPVAEISSYATPTVGLKEVELTEAASHVGYYEQEQEESEDPIPSIKPRLKINRRLMQGLLAAAAVGAIWQGPRIVGVLMERSTSTDPVATTTPATAPAQQTTTPAPANPAPVTVPPVNEVATVAPEPAPNNEPAPTVAATTPAPATTPAQTQAPAVTTTTTPPAVAIAAPTTPADPAALQTTVETWVNAWRSKNTDDVLKLYHTDFAPMYQSSKSEWANALTSSLQQANSTNANFSDFQVLGTDATGTTVRFWLNDEGTTSGNRTLKELVVGRDVDGELRILRELNREVRNVAAPQTATSTPTAPTPTATASTTTNTAPPLAPQAARPTSGRATATRTLIGNPVTVTAAARLPTTAAAAPNEVIDFVRSWLNSWQQKNVASYLNHYKTDFVGLGLPDNSSWRSDRTLKISRPPQIQIDVRDIAVAESDSNHAVLNLSIDYHSSFYADRTQKQVRLERGANGAWQIVMERNIQVEQLPVARLLSENATAEQPKRGAWALLARLFAIN